MLSFKVMTAVPYQLLGISVPKQPTNLSGRLGYSEHIQKQGRSMLKNHLGTVFLLAVFAIIAFAGRTFAQDNSKHSKMNPSGMSMDHCNKMMLDKLGKADTQYDARFIDMMIAHHQGAINMSKDALSKAKHSELQAKAQEIIDAQEKEISQMKAWRQAWYQGHH